MISNNLRNILENCHYVPMSTMKKVIEMMEMPLQIDSINLYCKRNLAKLQETRIGLNKADSKTHVYYDPHYRATFRSACWRAIYSHNWNKLLYLLKKCPPWQFNFYKFNDTSLYLRALLILLMYHPTSQAQGLLNEYLHLVWSCRSVEDKKAVLKILLTLPEKLHGIRNTHGNKNNKEC